MTKRFLVAFLMAILFASAAEAQSQLTRSQLESQINSTVFQNGAGAVTAAGLNTVLNNSAASSVLFLSDLGTNVSGALNNALNAANGIVSVSNTDSCIYQNSASAVAGCGTTLPSGLSFIGSNTSPTADGFVTAIQNGSKTADQIYSPEVPANYFFYDGLRSALDLESGTTVQQGSALAAYVYNNIAQGSSPNEANGVGLFSMVVNAINGAHSFGLNTTCNTAATTSTCIGYEADFTVGGSATVQGLSLSLNASASPANATGYSISSVGSNPWGTGFNTTNASAIVAASIGALAASGSNIASQPVNFNGFDAGSLAFAVQLQAIDHTLNVSDNTLSGDTLGLQISANPAVISSATLELLAASGDAISLGTGSTFPLNVNAAANLVYPGSDNSDGLGNASHRWTSIYGMTAILSTSVTIGGGSAITSSGPGGALTAPAFQSGAVASQTCTVNQAKTLIFTNGILTGGTCNG